MENPKLNFVFLEFNYIYPSINFRTFFMKIKMTKVYLLNIKYDILFIYIYIYCY